MLRKLLTMPINILLFKFTFYMLHKKAVGYDDIAIDLLTGREDDLCGILFELFLQVFLPAFIMELVTAH